MAESTNDITVEQLQRANSVIMQHIVIPEILDTVKRSGVEIRSADDANDVIETAITLFNMKRAGILDPSKFQEQVEGEVSPIKQAAVALRETTMALSRASGDDLEMSVAQDVSPETETALALSTLFKTAQQATIAAQGTEPTSQAA